jgi:hypothetical protein
MSVWRGRGSRCAWLALPIVLAVAGCRGEPRDPFPDAGRRMPAREKAWAGRKVPKLPVPAVGRPAVDWRRGGGRDRLVIGTAGVARGPARGPFTRTLFGDPRRAEDLRFFVASFAPFEMAGQGGELVFHGRGKAGASPPERRMIAEWARLVELEATAGDEGRSATLALSWQGGQAAGRPCGALAVDLSGTVRATCDGLASPLGPAALANPANPLNSSRLSPAALVRLYGWFDGLGPFQTTGEGAAAGRLIFAGRGRRQPTAEERAEIAGFAAALGRELDTRAGRAPAPASTPQGSEPPLAPPLAFSRLLRPAEVPPSLPLTEPEPVIVAPEVPPPLPDQNQPLRRK